MQFSIDHFWWICCKWQIYKCATGRYSFSQRGFCWTAAISDPQAPKLKKVSLKWSVSRTFVPIWKKSLQSIPEIGSCWERDWQHANTKPLAMAVTVWTRKTKSRYWVRAAPYCITLLNIKPSIRPSYLKDRTLWAIFPFRLLCFNPEPHSHSCSSSAGEEVASNCVCLRFKKKKKKKERERDKLLYDSSVCWQLLT